MSTADRPTHVAYMQLALEYNCIPEDFAQDENKLTVQVLHPARRRFIEGAHIFKMVTWGRGAVVCTDEGMHAFLRAYLRGKTGHWLFEHHHLASMEGHLGIRLWQTHHMYLPNTTGGPAVCALPLHVIEGAELVSLCAAGMYPNALGGGPDAMRPDVLAVAAFDGDTLAAIAGCSADTPDLWQIGVDTQPVYRGQGLGAAVVCALRHEIEKRGKIPYYGTSVSNLHSQRLALRCGFAPAWIEVTAMRD